MMRRSCLMRCLLHRGVSQTGPALSDLFGSLLRMEAKSAESKEKPVATLALDLAIAHFHHERSAAALAAIVTVCNELHGSGGVTSLAVSMDQALDKKLADSCGVRGAILRAVWDSKLEHLRCAVDSYICNAAAKWPAQRLSALCDSLMVCRLAMTSAFCSLLVVVLAGSHRQNDLSVCRDL
jgi:hypothetical protein